MSESSNHLAGRWITVGFEGDSIEVPPNTLLRFGSAGKYVTKNLSGSLVADKKLFGGYNYTTNVIVVQRFIPAGEELNVGPLHRSLGTIDEADLDARRQNLFTSSNPSTEKKGCCASVLQWFSAVHLEVRLKISDNIHPALYFYIPLSILRSVVFHQNHAIAPHQTNLPESSSSNAAKGSTIDMHALQRQHSRTASSILWKENQVTESFSKSSADEQLAYKKESDSMWMYELILRWLASQSVWLVFIAYCIRLLFRPSVPTLIIPFLFMCYALLQRPRPPRWFWTFCAAYTSAFIVLNIVFETAIFCKLSLQLLIALFYSGFCIIVLINLHTVLFQVQLPQIGKLVPRIRLAF